MGDYNIDLLQHELANNEKNFATILFSNSFYPVIDKHSRITKSTATLLDNIFTNNVDSLHAPGLLYCDVSDH